MVRAKPRFIAVIVSGIDCGAQVDRLAPGATFAKRYIQVFVRTGPRVHGSEHDERFIRRDGRIDVLRRLVAEIDWCGCSVSPVTKLRTPQAEGRLWRRPFDEVQAAVGSNTGRPGTAAAIHGGGQMHRLAPAIGCTLDPPQIARWPLR